MTFRFIGDRTEICAASYPACEKGRIYHLWGQSLVEENVPEEWILGVVTEFYRGENIFL